jgi:uncharacterized protein YodC (DUF2158 family)
MSKPIITDARPVYRIGDRVTVKETGEHMMVIGLDDQSMWIKCESLCKRFQETYRHNEIGIGHWRRPTE